ncbi:terminase small subunit [Paenibacillus sp. FSL H7-0331]|uniref:terminase small subunit n=1 Tax=Paenibacillus sp. FSL H7-0331 TaxID=1920421 RepID=UPI00096EA526|nr:terminase small subunit [Paenibacillus sp. FSL H7-0331]OMF06806.1 hypothetical protein BK127_30870 [Paenibacillus sp. FSL H7-0331]
MVIQTKQQLLLWAQAFADVSDYLDFGQREVPVMTMLGPMKDEEGNVVTKLINYVDLKPATELDVSLIAEVKQGKDGVGIKLHSKMEALEALTKFFDVLPDKHKRMIEEKKLELQREHIDIVKHKATGDGGSEIQDDGFIEDMRASAKEVWADETETGNVPLVSDVTKADQGDDLVDA